jgi:hypothetical protein
LLSCTFTTTPKERIFVASSMSNTMRHSFEIHGLSAWFSHRDLQNRKREISCVRNTYGIPTLFGGDFAQILPVVRRGKIPQIVGACLQRSPIWAQLSVRCLMENIRVAGWTGRITTLFLGYKISHLTLHFTVSSLPHLLHHFRNRRLLHSSLP